MDFMRLSLREAARVVVATDALGVIAVFQALIHLIIASTVPRNATLLLEPACRRYPGTPPGAIPSHEATTLHRGEKNKNL